MLGRYLRAQQAPQTGKHQGGRKNDCGALLTKPNWSSGNGYVTAYSPGCFCAAYIKPGFQSAPREVHVLRHLPTPPTKKGNSVGLLPCYSNMMLGSSFPFRLQGVRGAVCGISTKLRTANHDSAGKTLPSNRFHLFCPTVIGTGLGLYLLTMTLGVSYSSQLIKGKNVSLSRNIQAATLENVTCPAQSTV